MRALPGVKPSTTSERTSVGQYETVRVTADMQKLFNLTRGINLMMTSKRLIDCVLILMDTLKQTYHQVKASTVFILDNQLQHFIETEMGNQTRNCRQIPFPGFPNGHIIAIFEHPNEYCAPVFTVAEAANDSVCTSKLMYIPVYSQQSKLLFAY